MIALTFEALAWHGPPLASAVPVRRRIASPPTALLDDPSFLSSLSGLTTSLGHSLDADGYLSSLAYAASATAEAATRTATALESQIPVIPADLTPVLEARQAELLSQLEVIEALLKESKPPQFPFDLPDALAVRDLAGPLLAAVGLAASKTLDWQGSAPAASRPTRPYPSGRYDPVTSQEYYAARPLEVLSRVLSSAAPASGFGLSLMLDYLRGPEALRTNARVRAEQLVTALTAMGPTYIKVGQALSIRADLLSPPYIAALTGLQDRVPSFPTDEARAILVREWGLRDASKIDDLFVTLSPEPVAAASLGQVYRGTLKAGGREVAIKVQRPGVEGGIALDLLLIRALMTSFKRLTGANTDLIGLVDDWGRGFVDELDYEKEASNADAFVASIASSPLASVVTAPEVDTELSTKRVLVTNWVDGERLEKSQANDVSALCGVALNTYLSMLLETGLLHCDPHPGNLLRTSDGRLCILDWGLVTTVPEDLQLAFLEHVAHLVAKDYEAVPADLIALGFVPPGMESALRDSPEVVETLATVYSQWAGGGGVAKIDVNEVSSRLTGLTEEYGNFFQIPPYFAYVLRAFSVLEGIALINDPDYSILNECLPYISQRVLTDSSPRAAAALGSFVYSKPPAAEAAALKHAAAVGGVGAGALATASAHRSLPTPPLDAPRLAKLAAGFTSFSASSGGLSLDAEAQLERLAGQIVDLLLAREGSPLQDLLLDEAARLADASARDLVTRVSTLAERLASAPPEPLRAPLATLLDPLGVARASAPLLVRYDEDEAVLDAARALTAPLREALPASSDEWAALFREDDANGKLVRFVAGRLWERRGDTPILTARLAGRVLLRGIERIDSLMAAPHGSAADNSQPRSLAATLITGGLVALTTGLVAVAPEAQAAVVAGSVTHEPEAETQPASATR